ncbi:MAG TPA: insulinase family protein [Candidatus Dormibacteraeota bacterium]|nr:insulinase family protein [Candidatus Dormibacteraeota bacterium]
MATTARGTAARKSIAGYTITRREPLERLEGAYLELTHDRTGAKHIHIECPDDNNGFAVFFPTAPTDSTGVAHILEHVVLAGSQRYPVHDPFFSMTRRSLATFMNALTGSDWTMYLFSTRNAKDYRNLLDVYLDATFFPKLAEDSFKQEGIRFEFEEPADPGSGLRYKGVVFNEMKGALATPGAAVARAIGKTLFPGLPYSHVSGGDPRDIPNLTWENLKRFHSRHYHPSNAHFYTYGDQSLEETLQTIEEKALSKFDRITPDPQIPDVGRFARPTSGVETFPAPPGDSNPKLAQALTAWVTIPTASSFRLLAMKVLAEVLLGNAGSPLRKALIDSGLGSTLADGSGFHDDYKESVFGAGLKGIAEEDAEKVERVVLATLEKIADEGLDESQVDAAIHHLEFEKRERSNAGFPYALRVLFTLHPAYLYEGDPLKALDFDNDLEHLQKARQEGRFFENLIRAELLDNPHRALITVLPDKDVEERDRKQELERLGRIEEKLTAEDRKRIVEDALRLKQEQDARQDVSVLPTLELEDIPMKFEDVPSRDVVARHSLVEFYPQPTNGITYLDLRADFRDLTQERKDLLPVFARALTQSGAAGQDYAQIATRIASHTGGVGAAPQVQSLAAQDDYIESFVLSGKALDRNAQAFIELLTDLTAHLEIEPRRLREIIAEITTRLESSLAGLGFTFALLRSHAKISSEGALNDRLQGIGMLHTMRRLAKYDEMQLGGLIDALNGIRHDLFRTGALRIVVTCEESMIGRLEELITGLVAALPQDGAVTEGPRPQAEPKSPEARTAPVPVAFNVRFFKTVRYTHPDAPALLVLANYLRDTFLHRELREKGGAYGGFASAGILSGTFYLGSYRDPNIVRTYDVFDEAVTWVTEHEVRAESLKEAILGACGDVDPLESPDSKGRREATNRVTGLTREARERFKQRLLHVTAEDLRRVTATYLTGVPAVQTTVAGPDLIEAARKEKPGLFEVVAPL